MKKVVILIICTLCFLVNIKNLSAQLIMSDTIIKFSDNLLPYYDKSQEILKYMLNNDYESVDKNMRTAWNNRKLFKEVIQEASDSLRKYGIPDSENLVIKKNFIDAQNLGYKLEVYEFIFPVNSNKYVRDKSYSIIIKFFLDSGVDKISDLSINKPVVLSKPDLDELDKIMEELNKEVNKK